ncbi:MAG: D-2-hydroxyacid dehydrogenase [Opitutaceae bacterium]|nr:D-2-hydroxyacid dehydrogenase [Opitutaceae bacterium]
MKLLLNYKLTLPPEERRALAALAPGLVIEEQPARPAEALDGTGVTVLVSDHVPRDRRAWPELRWVQLLAAGANHLRGHPILESGLPVTTASGLHGVPIAQFVTCTWLMMAHRMKEVLEFERDRRWPDRLALAGWTVRGLTAGIVGYGSIGRECARQLSALGMRVIALKRDPANRRDDDYNAWPGTGDPEGRLPEAWYGQDELRRMLPACDLVVVTVPCTPATEGLIGREELAAMKPSARLINVSRGEIVDEAALAAALREGRLAGAAVDCYVGEPIGTDHFLFGVPNLIMTPHMSGVSTSFAAVMAALVRENLQRFVAGRPLLNRLDPRRGY